MLTLVLKYLARLPVRPVAGLVGIALSGSAIAAPWCGDGIWADAMLGSHHIAPQKSFKQFNPGLGVECWPAHDWALTVGGFRNSLARPSFYGGALWAPSFAQWGPIRLAVMGGVISGYNYGRWGITNTVGPVVAPIVMANVGRWGANLILIPPIPADHLPFTLGLQLKLKLN